MHWSSPLIIELADVYIFAHIRDYNSTVQIKLKILMVKPHFFFAQNNWFDHVLKINQEEKLIILSDEKQNMKCTNSNFLTLHRRLNAPDVF